MVETRAIKTTANSQNGFVLVATLWALAIVLAIAAGFDTFVSKKLELAIVVKEKLRANLDLYGTEQTLKYLLASQRITRAGLTTRLTDAAAVMTDEGYLLNDAVGGELALDSAPYQGLGNACFSLQDTAGLVGLNSEAPQHLKWLLESVEPDKRSVDELIDTLQDYRDENTRVRLNGAEASAYRKEALPPPSSYHIRAPHELYGVIGWKAWLKNTPGFHWWQWLSISRSVLLNPNTVPESLLGQMPGLSQSAINHWLQQRLTKPFYSYTDLTQRTGLRLAWPEQYYRFVSSRQLQFRLWANDNTFAADENIKRVNRKAENTASDTDQTIKNRQLRLVAIELTPQGIYGPWQQKYHYKTAIKSDTQRTCKKTGVEVFRYTGHPPEQE